jgi:hypothetical protein
MSFLRQAHTAYHVLPASKRNTTRANMNMPLAAQYRARARRQTTRLERTVRLVRPPAAATGQAWRATSTTLSEEAPLHCTPGAGDGDRARHGTPFHRTTCSNCARLRPRPAHHLRRTPFRRPLAARRRLHQSSSSVGYPSSRTDPFRFRLRRGSARPAGAEEYLGLVPIARATCRARIARRPDNHWTTGHGPDSGHLAGNGNKSGFACLVSQRAGRAPGLLLSAIAKATCSHRRTWTRNAARRV